MPTKTTRRDWRWMRGTASCARNSPKDNGIHDRGCCVWFTPPGRKAKIRSFFISPKPISHTQAPHPLILITTITTIITITPPTPPPQITQALPPPPPPPPPQITQALKKQQEDLDSKVMGGVGWVMIDEGDERGGVGDE